MSSGRAEQRNAYRGNPSRPVVYVGLTALDGNRLDIGLLADTGNPFSIVVSHAVMRRLKRRAAIDVETNFGILEGAWLELNMPEFAVREDVLAYASDSVAASAKLSDPAFDGLAGLPFLRLLEFGGDAEGFWLRSPAH